MDIHGTAATRINPSARSARAKRLRGAVRSPNLESRCCLKTLIDIGGCSAEPKTLATASR